ncbi:unnamed protein product [Chrysoparadoxa australica]
MLVPLVELPALTEREAGESSGSHVDGVTIPLQVLRLSMTGELYVKAGATDGEGSLSADAAQQYKPLLVAARCRVGDFKFDASDELPAQLAEAVVSWLDAGAVKAVISLKLGDALEDPSSVLTSFMNWTTQLPDARHRLIASISAADVCIGGAVSISKLTKVTKAIQTVCAGMQVEVSSAAALTLKQFASALKPLRGKEGASDYIDISMSMSSGELPPSLAHVCELHKDFVMDVAAPACVSVSTGPEAGEGASNGSSASADASDGSIDAAEAFAGCLRSDRPDGLFTTVVCDASGVALGLVYSNSDSIKASLQCGRGVYWSRSRGGLWRKGDTSGAWQELIGLTMDCDSDAIKFTVTQHGAPPAFCHFNRRNCWESDRGLGHLERTLQGRLVSAPEGSYTKRLFGDTKLLRNKLVEEAQELAEAETVDEVASEAADLMYFMMVRCVAAGVGVKDVESWLDRRSLKLNRRPGNDKAYRIAAGDAILSQGQGSLPKPPA